MAKEQCDLSRSCKFNADYSSRHTCVSNVCDGYDYPLTTHFLNCGGTTAAFVTSSIRNVFETFKQVARLI